MDAAAVGEVFGLGEPVGAARAVGGAYSHAVWEVSTVRGRYAVKVFDRSADSARGPDWWDWIAEAVRIECAAVDAGLPAPAPVRTARDEVVAEVPGRDGLEAVRVHPWVEGEAVGYAPRDAGLAAAAGGVLAGVHGLGLAVPAGTELAETWETQGDAELMELAGRAVRGEKEWAPLLERVRPRWRVVRELLESRRRRVWPAIATHRDLGPKNVLVGASGPVVLDWDVAGAWTAGEEAAAAALEFAGVHGGEPSRAAVTALLEAYVGAGGQEPPGVPEVLATWLVKNANWTQMHLRHALDANAVRRDRSERAAVRLLEVLEHLIEGAERWSGWIAAG